MYMYIVTTIMQTIVIAKIAIYSIVQLVSSGLSISAAYSRQAPYNQINKYEIRYSIY